MNAQRYRLVYNHIRKCLMAVAENVTSQGKTSGETHAPLSTIPSQGSHHWLRVIFTGIAWASYLLLTPALQAQIIADPNAPGHQQPTVGITANGVPQVDIQTPNAVGLSHNFYQQFDVPQNGVILNNSREEVQTQLGGLVNRNPHLINSGPAKTILNEVRSSDPSILKGFMEVAGQSAHVIVSNPSGITCDGCGFINAYRSTLTTGTPIINGAGNLEAYRITAGTINIFGNGLNDAKTYYTDILARAIAVNAKLHAQKLTGIMGTNTIPIKEPARTDGKQGEQHLGAPVPIAIDPTTDRDYKKPAFALDVAELGGLYAGHVYLIGTEAGLGIRTAKDSKFGIGEFRITHAGEIIHRGEIKAEGSANIIAAAGITNEAGASIAAQGNLTMSTQASIANKGTLAAKGNLKLIADGANSMITSYRGSSLLAGIGDDGKPLSILAQLMVHATQKASLNGKQLASEDFIVKSRTIDLSHSETVATHIKLFGVSGKADNIDTSDAKLTAREGFTADALYRLTTDRAIIEAKDFYLTATDFFNIGGTLTQTSANDWLLNFLGQFNNTDGTIKTNARHFGITAANIDNTRGTLDHQGSGNVSFNTHQLQSTASKITTANTLTVNTDQTVFDQAAVEAGHIDLTSRLFSNRRGLLKLIGTGLQTFNISGRFDNTQGQLLSNGNLKFTLGQLDGISLLNTGGTISALVDRTLTINAAGQIDNSEKDGFQGGSLLSGRKMVLEAQSIANAKGKIQSLQDSLSMTLASGSLNNAGGTIEANQHLYIGGYGIDNTLGRIIAKALDIDNHQALFNNTNGTVKSSTYFKLDTGELNNTGGEITSAGPMTIKSLAFTNDNGWVQSDAKLDIDTQGHLLSNINSGAGVDADTQRQRGLISLGAFTLKTGNFVNKAGRVLARGNLTVDAQDIDNEGGTINSDGTAQINATRLNNAYGKMMAAGLFGIQSGELNNKAGQITSAGAMNIKSTALTNDNGWIQSDTALHIDTQGYLLSNTNSGDKRGLISLGTLTLKTGDFYNKAGFLSAKGLLSLEAQAINNERGKISSQSNVNFTAASLDNTYGRIIALGGLTATLQHSFNNLHGYLAANQAVNITAADIDNQQGSLLSIQDSLTLKALKTLGGQIRNTSGAKIAAFGKLNLSSFGFNNTGGEINAKQIDLTTQGKPLDNTLGKIIATERLDIQSGELNNTDGQITNDGILNISSLALNNQRGWIQGKTLSIDTQGNKFTNADSAEGKGIRSFGSLTLRTGAVDNQRGRIHAVGTLDATTAYFDNRFGMIHADTTSTWNSVGFNNQHGTISVLGNATFQLQQNALDNDYGVIETNGTLRLTAGQLNNRWGKLLGKQAFHLLSHALDNQGGLIKSQHTVDINTQGHQLSNIDSGKEGGILSGGSLTLNTGDIHNQRGKIAADGAFTGSFAELLNQNGSLSSGGVMKLQANLLNNQHGLIVALGNIDLNLGLGEFDNSAGTLQAKGKLDLISGLLTNQGGSIKSAQAMTLNTQGQKLINTDSGKDGGISSDESVTIQAGEFDNRSGYLSGKNLFLTSTTFLNQRGVISGAENIQLEAQSLTNTGGWLRAEQTLSLLLGNGRLDNSAANGIAAGLISANKLAVWAGTLLNTASHHDNQGLRASMIDLNVDEIDNTGGLIHGDHTVTLHGREHINNTNGQISAGQLLQIADATTSPPQVRLLSARSVASHTKKTQRITNTGGKFYAGRQLRLNSAQLTSDGQLSSSGDMNIALHGDYTHTGNLSVNGALTFSTDGTFINQALFNALTNLSLSAGNLDNQAQGELSAGTSLLLNIAGNLSNRGLITAPTALIKALTVNNLGSGRLYGGTLAIGATTITNDSETVNGVTKAGTIAAQNRLDLATTTLNNQNHALIFSLGDMAIGATLDSNNQATGAADTVNNHAATIEALGQLSLDSNNLNNTNGGVVTEMQTVSSETITEYRLDYQNHRLSADKFIPQGTVIPCNPSTGRGDRCGGALNMGYAKLYPDRFGKRQYFKPIYRASQKLDNSNKALPKPLYQPDAATYTRFGVDMPAADATQKQKNEAMQALHKAITAYNASVQEDNRVGAGGHYYEYRYTASKSQPVVTKTDPGVIRSGGAMTLNGTNLVNDKSRIIAGGALTGDLANLRNIGMEGTATTTINGTVRYLSKSRSGRPRASGYSPYAEAPRNETVTLPLYQIESHTQATPMTRSIESGSAVSPVALLSVPSLTTTNQAPRAQSNNEIVLDKVAEFGLSRQPAVTESTTPVSASNSALSLLAAEQPPPSAIVAEQIAPSASATNQAAPQAVQPPVAATRREEIRTTQPNIALPTASLYTINSSAPATQPLIETDPRFTNYQQWLGSQALITAGSIDPNITQKRLGDNFYEQQLIRDQVGQLTGRRFLNGYQNDNDQYQALINNGVSVAQTFQLTPGIALTHEQMARLTSDIVWLVEKTVTLSDGSTTKVLVPQLYVKVKEGDLKGDGTLISGDSVQFSMTGDLNNSGTIAGRTLVDISAKNINNHLGRIQAADARLSALLDIHNIGGAFAADNSMALNAGQDINIQSTSNSTTAQNGTAAASRTHLDRVAGIYVGRNDGDVSTLPTSLIAQAGRDFNLLAAEIANHTTAASTFAANRNINLQTLETESSQTLSSQSKHHSHKENTFQKQDIGTTMNTIGEVNLQAGQDITAKAATLNSEQGAINLNAGHDITLEAGQQTHHFDAEQKQKSSGFLSSKSSTRRDSVTDTQALGSTVSGRVVNATAGHNITVTGSNMVSDSETNLTAANNVTVQNAQNSHNESHFYEEKKSGLMGSGGIGFTIGSQQQSQDAKSTETSSSASTVGATNGNVSITAGKTYTQVGSDVIALNDVNNADPNNDAGNVNVNAQKIDVLAAENTASQRVEEKFKQSGLTVAITSPVITAIQTAEQMRQAKDKTQNGRMKLLADAATVAAAYNAGAAVAGNKDQAGGVNISVSVGTSQSQSVSTQTAKTLTSSNVKAAKDINFNATGASEDSNINVVASNIKAGEDASFKADNDVNFLAGQNTSEQRSKNKSSSASIGVSFGTDGLLLNLSASGARGKANGQDTTHTHTEVEAGQTLTVESGRDTNLKGATAIGKQITANIGRDLNIESVQDSSTYDSKQQSVGGSLSVGYGKMNGSFSASQSKVNSDYLSVTQQSGFKAGDDGFDINVKGNTDLKAGLIASTDQAAAENKNKLSTGTLTTSDLNNKAEYEASSISVGVGTSATAGALNPAGMGFGNDGDNQTSTTKAGISQAKLTITDEEKQKQLTGKDAEQTIADLSRDVSTDKDTSGALTNKFDATRVQNEVDAQTQITQTFGQQAAQAIGTFAQSKAKEYSDKATDLRKQAANPDNNLSHDERQALFVQADQQSDEAAKWDEGGRYRVAMHTVAGGLVGNVAGAAAAATVASSAPKLNDLQRDLTQSLKDAGASESVANLASHLIAQTAAAGVGAAVGAATGNMTAGAAVGLNIDSNNRQLHPDEKQRIRDEIAKRYAKDQGVSETQATQILEAQLLRQVDSTAAKAGGWDQQAANYLNSYKASHAGETVGKDQWGNPVPLFGVGSQSQRNDSTIFSANPQTHTPPAGANWGSVGDYFKGIGQGIANTVGHPIDTLVNAATGLYQTVTDPKGTAEQMQAGARHVIEQAGEGNFQPAGQQVGEQIGTAVITTAVGTAVGKAIKPKVDIPVEGASPTEAAKQANNFYRDGAQFESNIVRDRPLANLRLEYEQASRDLLTEAKKMQAAGVSDEQVARWAVDRRNQLKDEYRGLTPPEKVPEMEARNIEKYQNPLGPTVEQLRAKNKSWQQIIEGAARPGGDDVDLSPPGFKK